MKKMTKNKKLFRTATVLAVVVALGASLAGCGSSEGETTQRYSWPLATASPEDTVTQIFAEKFAEEISELSDGKMKIQVYANSTLGGDRDLLETCADGDIPFVVQNTAPQVSFMGDLAVFDLPCVFDSLDECREKIDNPEFYDLISNVYTEGGYHLLGMADQGFRVMSTNKPVYSFSDFKGQKIRTMENPNHIAYWQALGANPTPADFSELYMSLEQGTLDAQENPYDLIVANKLYEPQAYVIETNHLLHTLNMVGSKATYDALPADIQQLVSECAAEAHQYARQMADERIEGQKSTIQDAGLEIITLEPAMIQEMADVSANVYDLVREQIGTDLVDSLLAQVETASVAE